MTNEDRTNMIDYALIEDYLDGLLSEAECTAFETQVQADPVLASALADVREARERLPRQWARIDSEAQLIRILQSLGEKHFGKSPGPTTPSARRFWWILLAAVVVALMLWFLWPKTNNNPQKLYAAHRHFPIASFVVKGSAGVNEASLALAEADFNQKKYDSALTALQTYLGNESNDLEARFFAGLCQLETGHLSEAESTFLMLKGSGSAWSDEASWYLALTYLRQGALDRCVTTLQQIAPNTPHANEAAHLLRQIEKR